MWRCQKLSRDYLGGLQDFNKTNILKLKSAFILKICGNVKKILHDYHGLL